MKYSRDGYKTQRMNAFKLFCKHFGYDIKILKANDHEGNLSVYWIETNQKIMNHVTEFWELFYEPSECVSHFKIECKEFKQVPKIKEIEF